MTRRHLALGALLTVGSSMLVGAPAAAQTTDAARAVAAAQAGEVVLVCRHAETDSFREREPVDYDDPTTQRRLDEGGEAQSRRIGAAWRELGLEVTRLVASPMDRARRTAELMLDRPPQIDSIWHTNGSDYSGAARDARLAFLRTPVERGVVVVVSHIGTMSSVLPDIRGDVGEGACVVVRPRPEEPEIVGVVASEEWRPG
ncbi:MAG: histidine phosphatase family protein [Gemmatimonadota bacterium]